jgi:hypothetical protein
MADDDGNQAPADGEPTVSVAQIKDAVREVLAEMGGLSAKAPDLPDDTDDDDKPVYSARQAEDIARKVVEDVMPGLLAAAAKKSAPKPKAKASDDEGDDGEPGPKPKEPAPTPPKETGSALTLKLRKFFVGADV